MAKYTGPRCKLSRREGVDLLLTSSERDLKSKCKLEVLPGQHGAKRTRLSDYGMQLRAKQRIRRLYGVLERQFRRYYYMATQSKGSTAGNLLRLLEARLDNVVYRMGFARTRAEARQLVNHKSITVNEKVTNIPSYSIAPGDIIAVRDKSKQQERVKDSINSAKNRPSAEWIEVNTEKLEGTFKNFPTDAEVPSDLNPQLVIELYSK